MMLTEADRGAICHALNSQLVFWTNDLLEQRRIRDGARTLPIERRNATIRCRSLEQAIAMYRRALAKVQLPPHHPCTCGKVGKLGAACELCGELVGGAR